MKPRTIVSGIKLENAPVIKSSEHQQFYNITDSFTTSAQPGIHHYFVENHPPLEALTEVPHLPPTPPARTTALLHGAEHGDRQWFQFLTHDGKGEFNSQRTIISAAIVAAVVMGVAVLTRKREEDRAVPAQSLMR